MSVTFGAFRSRRSDVLAPKSGAALRMSDAYRHYAAHHADNPGWLRKTEWTFHRWFTVIGDCRILDIRHADIRRFMALELERGLKTFSVKHAICILCAAVWACAEENDLNLYNPFHRIRVPKLGFDAKRLPPASIEDLLKIQARCISKDDDIRWLLAILSDTGARVLEIAGLALSDIQLSVPIPHLTVRSHPWRRLKTKNAQRLIPLAGVALWAARRILATATPSQVAAFPRYVWDGTLHDPSAALRYWMETQAFPYTPHGFRHILIDRLREVECPPDIRRAICGWSPFSYEARYGFGYPLKLLHYWMSKICNMDVESHARAQGPNQYALTMYQCMLGVMYAIAESTYRPSFGELLRWSGMSRLDVRRGLSGARKGQLLTLVTRATRVTRPSRGFYVLTGRLPPPPPQDAKSIVLYSVMLALMRGTAPRMQFAECFWPEPLAHDDVSGNFCRDQRLGHCRRLASRL